MSEFKTYKVEVTFDIVTRNLNYTVEHQKRVAWSELISEIQNKIRLFLSDNKNLLATDPKIVVTEK